MFNFCEMFLTPILILTAVWIITFPVMVYAETTEQDQQLAKALKYYFDKEYEKALPIFKEIAEREETMDLMFWIGTSAARTGKYEIAEKKLKQMLEKDPAFHIVRLELADIYIKTGRFDQARKELEKVKAASPPPAIVKNIDRRLAVIEQQSRKLDWSMMLSAGVQYDDNISTGPDDREIPVSGGTVTLTDRQKKLDDFSWLTRFVGDVRYDIGAPRGLVWDTKAHFFSSSGIDYSEFDIRAFDISTGPWWVGPRDIIKIPVGYMNYDYGSDNLSETFHVDPSIEHFFNRFFSMQAFYTFADEDYEEEKVAGMDSDPYAYSIGSGDATWNLNGGAPTDSIARGTVYGSGGQHTAGAWSMHSGSTETAAGIFKGDK